MMNDVSPYFLVEPTCRKDKGLILWLMGCLSAFLLSLPIVSGHKATASWPMASPMTLSSDTFDGLFMRFLQWNSSLSTQIAVSLCKLRFCSSLEQMGWYACSCILLVWPIMISSRPFVVSWKVLLSLDLLFFYWIWRIVSLSHAFFDFVFCSSLSMVRGREVQTLWPMASPLTFYSLALFWECVYHGLSSFMANVAYPV